MTIADPLRPPALPATLTRPLCWGQLSGSSMGLAISQLLVSEARAFLIVAPDTETALRLSSELAFFNPEIAPLHFPDWETLPYDQFSPHQDIISERSLTLTKMPLLKQGAIITSISTLMHRLPPPDFLLKNSFLIHLGETLSIQALKNQLAKGGYSARPQVREHGEFAVRGSIIDLFPMGSSLPFRIDLLDDEVDSIRTFSPDTQRTLDKIDKIELLPAKEFPLNENSIELFRQRFRSEFSGNPLNCTLYQEISEGICPPGIEYYLPFFFDRMANLFDYLPKNSLIIKADDLSKKAEDFWREAHQRYEQLKGDLTRPLLKPGHIFMPPTEIMDLMAAFIQVDMSAAPVHKTNAWAINFDTHQPLSFPIEKQSVKPLQHLENFLIQFEGRVLFCAETRGRREVLLQLFQSISLKPTLVSSWLSFIESDIQYGLTVAPLEEGLQIGPTAIALIAETQLFGKRALQRRRTKETAQDLDAIVKDLTELQIGSPIVHLDHGVGRYLGLKALTIHDQLAEFLCIEYADSAKLYVPVTSLHLISRYSGTDPDHAPLHQLGSPQWQRAKRKAAEQLRDVAAELLDLYAARAAQKNEACKIIDSSYANFAAAFPFEETQDQLNAIEQVLDDMMKELPMDRLICGDVGFGKTEVAMRAAFFAVQNNKQVAVLVPTTLLAQQHFQSFQDRFADWPVRIASMSRFNSSKEQQQTIQQLAEGKIDILIGTHKLLQQEIRFKNLGLIVIDEEHRFGVHQKERLKKMRLNVNMLTLTATPIPRTLNMAFSGVRDLSLIATPPARRLSIKTFVHEYQQSIIQEGILREILRGGQVYFLHNNVATIEKTTRDLEKLVPEARIAFAHGQMRERELEQIMSDFYHRRFNVLVSTTIIESGIDVPSANTIIIDRADKLGLAQLHQLRGRVGRSHHQAYAYLLIPSRKLLTPDAEKRLDAITSYEDLGIGFTLATHDLEIRGAGELLGKNQSGQMQEIGFTLYMDLLSRTVDALKSGKTPNLEAIAIPALEINLNVPALIPDHYLADVHLRLQCYKRIASAKNANALDDIQVEMIDRFGLLPPPTKNLFAITLIKQKAEQLGIIKIEANHQGGKIDFNDKPNVDPMRIIQLVQTQSKRFKLEGPKRLRFQLSEHPIAQRIELIEKIVEGLV